METKPRTHFMGTPFAQRTACGRYIPTWDTQTVWTPQESQVTCRRCLKSMGAAA